MNAPEKRFSVPAISLVILLSILTIQSLSAQQTLTADNNYNAPTGPNMFTSVQAAVNAASDGDIIQVQPSPVAYGSVVIDRQVTLQGIGFNLNKDIPITSVMGDITLRNNAGNSNDADGTVIIGLQFGNLFLANNGSYPQFTLENVRIENCQFSTVATSTGSAYSSIDGLEIIDCYITSNSAGYGIYFYKPTTDVLLRNNLVLYDIGFFNTTAAIANINNNLLYGGIRVDAVSGTTNIRHNLFIGATNSESAFTSTLRDCTIENNIFFGSTPSISATGGSSSTNFQDNDFKNNLTYATGEDVLPPSGGGAGNTGSGNLIGDPLFVNGVLVNSWSSAYDFTLQVGSPALSAATDGSDIGLSGGVPNNWSDPNFVLNTSKLPVIEIFNTNSVINPTDDLSIRVKAYSN